MSVREEINRTIDPKRLVWSERLDEQTRKQVDALKKQRNNKVYIYQNFYVYGNIDKDKQGWIGRGFEIAIINERNCNFRLATFTNMRDFKLWMHGLGVKCVDLSLLSKNNKGERIYEASLDTLVINHSYGGFWSLRDLPFFEETSACNKYMDGTRITTAGFPCSHRYPVMCNGYLVWGYIQAMDGVRIIYTPNPNAEIYQPIVYDYRDKPIMY